MRWPKSEGRRSVDLDLGGGAQNSPRRKLPEVQHVKALQGGEDKCRSSNTSVTEGNCVVKCTTGSS